MLILFLANRFIYFLRFSYAVLQKYLKGTKGTLLGFAKASWGVYTDFKEAFVKLFVAPMWL